MKSNASVFRFLGWNLLALAVLAAGCAHSPYTGRSQFMLISRPQELALGYQASEEVKREARLITTGPVAERIRQVGWRIAQASGRTDFDWEFNLIDEDTVNAFCLPGGKVFLYTGIMRLIHTDAELATVIAHEVAHALARHGAERMSMTLAAQMGGQVAAAAIGFESQLAANAFYQAFGMGAQVGVLLPYSREMEYEADYIGLILMAKAGYDPNAAVGFWKKMAAEGGGPRPPVWLSTHPPGEDRIQAIARELPRVRAEYYRPSDRK